MPSSSTRNRWLSPLPHLMPSISDRRLMITMSPAFYEVAYRRHRAECLRCQVPVVNVKSEFALQPVDEPDQAQAVDDPGGQQVVVGVQIGRAGSGKILVGDERGDDLCRLHYGCPVPAGVPAMSRRIRFLSTFPVTVRGSGALTTAMEDGIIASDSRSVHSDRTASGVSAVPGRPRTAR